MRRSSRVLLGSVKGVKNVTQNILSDELRRGIKTLLKIIGDELRRGIKTLLKIF